MQNLELVLNPCFCNSLDFRPNQVSYIWTSPNSSYFAYAKVVYENLRYAKIANATLPYGRVLYREPSFSCFAIFWTWLRQQLSQKARTPKQKNSLSRSKRVKRKPSFSCFAKLCLLAFCESCYRNQSLIFLLRNILDFVPKQQSCLSKSKRVKREPSFYKTQLRQQLSYSELFSLCENLILNKFCVTAFLSRTTHHNFDTPCFLLFFNNLINTQLRLF